MLILPPRARAAAMAMLHARRAAALALCCCCSCWISGGRLPSDDGILSRDREREKEDKEPLTVVQGLPVTDAVSRLPLMSMNDNARL